MGHKVINFLTILAMVGILGAVAFAFTTIPERVETPQEKQFLAFVKAWQTADDTYRIEKFNRDVRNELVEWDGLVGGIDHRGTAFYLIPLEGGGTFHAYLVLNNGEYVPADLVPFRTHVRVLGKIDSASVLGVIVKVQKVTKL